jgi:replicative DNA helicase
MTEGIHYAKDIEAAVLGICLIEKDAFTNTVGLIGVEVFYIDDNQKVYLALREMHDKSMPIDTLTVWQRMTQAGITLNAGTIPWYMAELQRQVVSSAHLEAHCEVLRKMWRLRELEKLTRSGIDPTRDERTQAQALSDKIAQILADETHEDWLDLDDLYMNLIIHQEAIGAGKKEFIPSGFRSIDRLNGGFTPGQLVIVGARPSVGKSALANVIVFAAAKKGKSVGVISLEMNNTELAGRLAAIQTETSFSVIYRNLFNDEKASKEFRATLTNNSGLPIYVSDKTKVDVNEIRARAVKLKRKKGLDLLIVDYLQLVESVERKGYNREQEVAKISRGMKLLAMELQIPIVMLCQLNRAVTHRKAKERYPQLSDLRESGAIEQDADVVLMLHRDWLCGYEVHPETGNSTELDADLLGVKWRNGATFHLELDFNPQQMKFSERGGNLIPVHISKDECEEELF